MTRDRNKTPFTGIGYDVDGTEFVRDFGPNDALLGTRFHTIIARQELPEHYRCRLEPNGRILTEIYNG